MTEPNYITPDECEHQALIALQAFVDACGAAKDRAMMADRMMKLVSVTAVQMAKLEGRDAAKDRLAGVAYFIWTRGAPEPVDLENIQ